MIDNGIIMPPKKKKAKKPNPISIEWGESLVGLPMAVPENWWTYCTGYNLHNGKIVSFDQKKKMEFIIRY